MVSQIPATVVAFAISALLIMNPGANAASFQGLGDLPGGVFSSSASGVSSDGSVVVGRGRSASGDEAFRWTSSGGMVGLGSLPAHFSSFATDVSSDGSVVVGRGRSASGDEAFRWTSSGGMVGLGDLPGGSFFSFATGVSSDGSVVVGESNSTSGNEAFRWTSGGGMVGLGSLPAHFSSVATDVSSDGSVVVGGSTGTQAFRWTSGGGMVSLGRLFASSGATGVSSDGSVVVGQASSTSGTQAFRWTSGSGMIGLGDLPGGEPFSSATGVSSDGSVVVGTGRSASGREAFIWDSVNGMRSLRDVLINDLGLGSSLAGWSSLSRATAISPNGRFIVGAGIGPNGTEAFLVDLGSSGGGAIPEPSTATLLALGLSMMACRRRRGVTRKFAQRLITKQFVAAYFAAGVLVFCGTDSHAAVLLFDNRDDWQAAFAASTEVDENLSDESATVGTTQQITLLGSGIVIDVSAGVSDAQGDLGIDVGGTYETLADDGTSRSTTTKNELDLILTGLATDPSQLTFTLPFEVSAVSFDFDQLDNSGRVFFSAGNSSTQTDLRDIFVTVTPGVSGFFGYLDTSGRFDTFTLTHQSLLGGGSAGDNFEIGRISFASVAIPEPSSCVLVGLGLLSAGLCRRRRADSTSIAKS